MHGFDTRRIDENLVFRPRLRQFGNPVRIELERKVGLRRAVGAGLEVVRAQRGPDDAEIAAQDPVFVEIRHLLEGGLDPGRDLEGSVEPRHRLVLALGRPILPGGVQADPEQFHQHPRNIRIGGQRGLDIGLAEGGPGLAQIFAIGAQDDDLPPSDPRPQHEPVEPVVLDLARPDPGKGVAERLVDAVGVEVGTFPVQHPEVVQPDPGRVGPLDLAGVLVLDLEAHILQHRERVGQRDRPAAELEELEAQPPLPGFERAVEAHLDAVFLDALHLLDVEHGDPRGIGLPVVGAEGVAIAPEQARTLLLAETVEQRIVQLVGPGAADDMQPLFEVRPVVLRRRSGIGAHDEKEPGQHRFRQAHRELGVGRAERVFQNPLDDQPALRGEAVPRHEYDAGAETPEPVRMDEQADPLPFLQMQDSGRRLEQLPGRDLEQEFAGEGIDDILQRLGGVAVRRISGAALQVGRLLPQQGDVERRAVERLGRVEPDETVLPGNVAVGVEPPDGDAVEMARPVHPRTLVRARNRQQFDRRRAVRAARRQAGRRLRQAGAFAAQQTEPGARLRHEPFDAAGALHTAGAVAKEGEMIVLDPFEKRLHLVPVPAGDRRRQRVEFLDAGAHPLAHAAPVLHRDPHIAEHGEHLGRYRIERFLLGLAGGLDMDERLDAASLAVCVLHGKDRADAPLLPSLHAHHRVDDEVARMAAAVQHHAHGIDQERHVVGYDLDDGVGGLPAVLLDLGVVDADLGLAGSAPAGEVEMRRRCAVQVFRPALDQIFQRGARIVEGDERKRGIEVRARQPPARDRGDLLEQFGLLRVGLHCHGRHPFASSRPACRRARRSTAAGCLPRLRPQAGPSKALQRGGSRL